MAGGSDGDRGDPLHRPAQHTVRRTASPIPDEAAAHLFQVISRRYEHGSIILTTNRSIADWGAIFDDTTVATAILDRLLHHATLLPINGDSYRMRHHRDAIQTLRPTLNTPTQDGEFP